MNIILDLVVKASDACKPLLLKVLPYSFLRDMKKRVVSHSYDSLLKMEIQPFDRAAYPDGINLIGNIKAETGLGESCRLVAAELQAMQDQKKLPYSVYQYNPLGSMMNGNHEYDHQIRQDLPYNINLIHINPHELGLVYLQMEQASWDKRYNIGFWLWELEDFPDEWVPCFHGLDEVWTPSEFISRSLRKKTDKPVVTVPYHVPMKQGEQPYLREQRAADRKAFGLPEDEFLMLMMYDKNSMTERKNPKGVLEAYQKAFRREEPVGLVIKINNCNAEELQKLKKELHEYGNVYFVTDILPREQVNSLIRCVDAVASLHRAEGFGLVMAEAMLLGTPVIATNWSSNTEFMNSEIACMVDYRLIDLTEDIGVFKKGNHWANPDVDQAAGYMRKLYDDPAYAAELAAKARKAVQETLSMEQAVDKIQKRVQTIYQRNQ